MPAGNKRALERTEVRAGLGVRPDQEALVGDTDLDPGDRHGANLERRRHGGLAPGGSRQGDMGLDVGQLEHRIQLPRGERAVGLGHERPGLGIPRRVGTGGRRQHRCGAEDPDLGGSHAAGGTARHADPVRPVGLIALFSPRVGARHDERPVGEGRGLPDPGLAARARHRSKRPRHTDGKGTGIRGAGQAVVVSEVVERRFRVGGGTRQRRLVGGNGRERATEQPCLDVHLEGVGRGGNAEPEGVGRCVLGSGGGLVSSTPVDVIISGMIAAPISVPPLPTRGKATRHLLSPLDTRPGRAHWSAASVPRRR